MIRNVVLGRIREGVGAAELEAGLQELRDLRVQGVEFELRAGRDLGLREGNADFVITVDLADEEAYRQYDEDAEHNRIRQDVFGRLCASLERVQFVLPDGATTL
ncbi:hypothetical protein GCM10010472_48070 [Pseudonocardia halophobica]|uniref:Stress-response A/B barrel domain-containing protein n=1 Tax=Pseudonocardia halophobica TaxID=29401 RepID=A0A9W6L4Q0_9PSEU|nr:Dabb family protein [Pseudonocardia halophobica]GLL13622.1 hypothetical protein GCM10017577_47660 [Pseudonocardia halophobica]